MDAVDPRRGWAEHVEAEHRHFGRMINEIRRAFEAPVQPGNLVAVIADAHAKLTVFSQQMRAHFDTEEEGRLHGGGGGAAAGALAQRRQADCRARRHCGRRSTAS